QWRCHRTRDEPTDGSSSRPTARRPAARQQQRRRPSRHRRANEQSAVKFKGTKTMRLTMHLLLVGLLTGVVLEPAQAGEGGCDCPPGPPGGPHFGPPTFDRRVGPGGGDEHFKPPMPLAEFDQNKDGRVTRS